MSTELTNTSKLREFVEELKKLKIEIIKPSINKCFQIWSYRRKIILWTWCYKKCGFEAITNIVNERINNGLFRSIVDFINR